MVAPLRCHRRGYSHGRSLAGHRGTHRAGRSRIEAVAFSIVIPTWNSAGDLPALLASVREHLHGAPEVLVVDNDSQDGTLEAAEESGLEPRVLALDENRGFAAACNIGVRAAS